MHLYDPALALQPLLMTALEHHQLMSRIESYFPVHQLSFVPKFMRTFPHLHRCAWMPNNQFLLQPRALTRSDWGKSALSTVLPPLPLSTDEWLPPTWPSSDQQSLLRHSTRPRLNYKAWGCSLILIANSLQYSEPTWVSLASLQWSMALCVTLMRVLGILVVTTCVIRTQAQHHGGPQPQDFSIPMAAAASQARDTRHHATAATYQAQEACQANANNESETYQLEHTPADDLQPASVKKFDRRLIVAVWICFAITILPVFWWHSGQNALGRSRSSCEDGDAVATRSHGVPHPSVSYLDDSFEHVDRISKPVRIKGLPADPQRKVVVKPSTLPGAGLGLFAAKDLVTFADRPRRLQILRCPVPCSGPVDRCRA